MGFKPLSDKQRKLQRKNDNNYLIGEYDVADDPVVPMKATIKDIRQALEKRSREMYREEIENPYSIDLMIKV